MCNYVHIKDTQLIDMQMRVLNYYAKYYKSV